MDENTRYGIQKVVEDLKKEMGDSQFLYESAMNFITQLNIIVNNYKHTMNIFGNGRQPLANLGEVMTHSKDRLTQIIKQQYKFQAAVNKFLGRQINFVWVNDQTGEIIYADEVTSMKIYELATASTDINKKTVGKIGGQAIEEMIAKGVDLSSFMDEEYAKIINKRAQLYRWVYMESMTRRKKNETPDNKKKIFKNTVYWEGDPQGAQEFANLSTKWSWSHRVNYGHIAQGYIDLIFNNSSFENTGTESGIGTFMMNHVGSPDRIPGIVKGDITVQVFDDRIQFAVKSTNTFNTASIGPYLRLAYQVIGLREKINTLTVEDIQKILKNLYRYSAKLTQSGREIAENEIANIAKESGAKVTVE